MICHKHNFIYIHIPRTGGVSLEKVFHHRYPRHQTLSECVKRTTLECVQDYYKFTFVRNPWDKVVSWYFYHTGKLYRPRTKEGFADWVRGGMQHHWVNIDGTRWTGRDPLSCFEWLANDHELSFDYIGRFETYQEDFDTICDNIGIPRVTLPHKNKSKHKHYSQYYDNETRDIVAEKYSKDLCEFGYVFERE